MQTSDFIDNNTDVKEKQLIDSGSSTSITYKLSKEGRLYFMKQLRPEYASDPRYRSLFFKEYECGKAISHPYVVRYTDIGEDEEGLYIIMEYVHSAPFVLLFILVGRVATEGHLHGTCFMVGDVVIYALGLKSVGHIPHRPRHMVA